jgi:hypothetical protein
MLKLLSYFIKYRLFINFSLARLGTGMSKKTKKPRKSGKKNNRKNQIVKKNQLNR